MRILRDDKEEEKKKEEERMKLEEEYVCGCACRICPFPGAQCCKDKKPIN